MTTPLKKAIEREIEGLKKDENFNYARFLELWKEGFFSKNEELIDQVLSSHWNPTKLAPKKLREKISNILLDVIPSTQYEQTIHNKFARLWRGAFFQEFEEELNHLLS